MEKSLYCLRQDLDDENQDPAGRHVQQLLCGDFTGVLNSEELQKLLCLDSPDLWLSWDLEAISTRVSTVLDSAKEGDCALALVGAAAALCVFAQANWTGPDRDCQIVPLTGGQEHRDRCLSRLALDGTGVYPLLRCPESLALARVVLEGCQHRLSALPSFPLWRLRYCWLYQQALEEPSPHLFSLFEKDIRLSEASRRLLAESRQVAVEHYLTVASMYNHYHHVKETAEYVAKAQKALRLDLQMVGALGTRTYYQQSQAQLALKISENPSTTPDSPSTSPTSDAAEDGVAVRHADESEPATCDALPPDLRHNDDTRRERVQYEDDALLAAASPLQQALVCTRFFQELRAQGRSEIRDEQLLVMLEAVTRKPQIWAVQLATLLQRSKLESDRRRSAERAMTQTQALVDAVTQPTPPPHLRLQLFFCTRLPTRWELEGELAARYLALGVTKAALEVYERLQMWEEAIQCYHLLQQRNRAAETIQHQISLHGESPKLLCLLGDATDDVTLYQRAWEMSGEKFVRAIRSESLHYYHRKQYERCIPLLRRAVEMNALQFGVWSRLAYAALQTEDWPTCAAAYRRCCHLEPDNFEAWNNISHAYIKLGHKERAWKALQEALRNSFDNWKVWENFMVVSVDIGEFEEALSAYSRLSELRERHVDADVLRLLVAAVIKDTPDRRGTPAGRLRRRAAALLGKLTSQVTTSSDLWSLYGDLAASGDDASDEHRYRTLQHYQRAHRCLAQPPGGEKQRLTAEEMLRNAAKVAEAALQWAAVTEPGPRLLQTLAAVKLAVRGTLTKVKSAQTDASGQVAEPLRSAYSEAEAALQRVLDTIQARQDS